MLRYYSFYMGDSGSRRSTWRFEDCKILAADVKSAIMLHFFLRDYQTRSREHWISNKNIYYEPAPIAVDFYYRAVVEYERLIRPAFGKTLVQFRKIREISQYEFVPMFKGKKSIFG